MARKAIIIGQSRDMFGRLWDVREERPTRHRFSLLIGWPLAPDGTRQSGKGYGGPGLVPTRDLYRYWRKGRLKRGYIYDLPASSTAIKRVRSLMRFNQYQDRRRWWMARVEDLLDLSGAEFARRHKVLESDVSEARKYFFGSRQRPNGWWREPEIRAIICSDLSHAEISRRLEIPLSSSRRLRHLLEKYSKTAWPVRKPAEGSPRSCGLNLNSPRSNAFIPAPQPLNSPQNSNAPQNPSPLRRPR